MEDSGYQATSGSMNRLLKHVSNNLSENHDFIEKKPEVTDDIVSVSKMDLKRLVEYTAKKTKEEVLEGLNEFLNDKVILTENKEIIQMAIGGTIFKGKLDVLQKK